MSDQKEFVVRCRGIIVYEDKMLLVRGVNGKKYALPGGHLEFGESVADCIKREIVEELGVMPILGNILYINNYLDGIGHQSIELFFEIKNGKDFLDCDKLERTHSYELSEIVWKGKDEMADLMPRRVAEDFQNEKLFEIETRLI